MTQTRIVMVADLMRELAQCSPSARVFVRINTNLEEVNEGPLELVERSFTQSDGPVVILTSNHPMPI